MQRTWRSLVAQIPVVPDLVELQGGSKVQFLLLRTNARLLKEGL
jgi:hypothetical protein